MFGNVGKGLTSRYITLYFVFNFVDQNQNENQIKVRFVCDCKTEKVKKNTVIE